MPEVEPVLGVDQSSLEIHLEVVRMYSRLYK